MQQYLTQIYLIKMHLKQNDEGKAHSQDQPELSGQRVVLIGPVVSIAAQT